MNPQHKTRYTYFLTAATHDRFPFFHRRNIAQAAFDTILGYNGSHFELHAAVVMPDHVHVLFSPNVDQLLERCVQCIKGGISHRIRDYRKGAVLWQRSTNNHQVRDDGEFLAFIEYIRRNPEKRGLKDWPFVYVDGASRG